MTGATGYLGGRLLGRLLESGAQVCAVVHPSDDAELPAGVRRLPDPGTGPALSEALVTFTPDVFVHLAANQTLTDAPDDSDRLIDTNIGFGSRVLAAARTTSARGLLWASTFSVHADGGEAYMPQTLYAATKQAFSDLAAYYSRNSMLRCVGLELSDTYGPDDPRPKFLSLLASGQPFDATAGEQIVMPIHADDVADAFVFAAHALTDGLLDRETYSVCGPDAVTVRELADEFGRATGRPVLAAWGGRAYRQNEIMVPYVGESLPGWRPRYSLREGLAAVYRTEE